MLIRKGRSRVITTAMILTVMLGAALIIWYGGPVAGVDGAAPAKPNAPTDLTASVTNGGVSLSWIAPEGSVVTGYRILRRQVGGASKKLVEHVPDTGNTATEYVDRDVEDGIKYVYRVKALNDARAGTMSNVARVKYVEPLGAPGDLVAVVDDGVALTWTAPTEGTVTGYRILRRQVGGASKKLVEHVPDTGNTATEYVDRDVEDGIKYVYRVKALNDARAGTMSNVARVKYVEPLGAPGDLVAVVDDGVALTWTAPTEGTVTGYRILRRQVGGASKKLVEHVPDTGNTATEYVDRDVEDGIKYVYRVKALNDARAGTMSNVARVKYVEPLGAPGDLRTANDRRGIELTWTAPTEGTATGYRIMRRMPGKGEQSMEQHVVNTGNTDTEYVDSDVEEGREYVYSVTALNGARAGEPSSEATLTHIRPTSQGGPGQPTALVGKTAFGGVKLTWRAPTSGSITANYQIFRRAPGQGETDMPVYVEDTGSTETEYTDENVVDGERYEYRVRAVNVVGGGQLSSIAGITYDESSRRMSVGVGMGRTGLIKGTTSKHVYSVNGLKKDLDPSTVDLTMRADVKDSQGRDYNDCEQDGMGISRTLSVVDEEMETFAITFGNADGSCISGDYTIEAVFDNGKRTLTHTSTFVVVGDAAVIEVDDESGDSLDD